MSKLLRRLTKSQKPSALNLTISLFALAVLLFMLQDYEVGFSQNGDLGFGSNTTNMTSPTTGSSQPSGFVSQGTINTVIDVPNGKWLAAGNWSMIVNNGNVTSFDTKMTWYNSSGTNAHTHDLTNFKSVPGETQLPMSVSGKQTIIKGVSDVSSNGKVSWSEVPTTITINDEKIISIAVDDAKTNSHFGGQSLLGIVDTFVPCSDLPGPNMELLPSCTQAPIQEEGFGFVNDSLAFDPSQGFPSENFSQGFPSEDFSQGFPSEDFSQGFPDQGQSFPSEDFSQGFPDQGQSFPDQGQGQDLPSGQFPNEDDQTDNTNDEESQPEISSECEVLEMENITASGFESDPSDYHPPSDAFDGESSTWWSDNGNDPWLEIDLSETQNICGVTVQWNKGDSRDYTFEIEVSEDGNDYEKVFEGNNNKGSTEPETYPFEEEINGQFIRLTTTDTSSGDGWVSVQEFGVLGMPIQ